MSKKKTLQRKTAARVDAISGLQAKKTGWGLMQGERGGAPQVPSLKPQGGGGGVQGERQIRGRQTDQQRGEGGVGGRDGGRGGSQRLPSNKRPASPLLFRSQDGAPLVPAHIFNGSITANGLNQGTEAKAC